MKGKYFPGFEFEMNGRSVRDRTFLGANEDSFRVMMMLENIFDIKKNNVQIYPVRTRLKFGSLLYRKCPPWEPQHAPAAKYGGNFIICGMKPQ